MDHHALPDSPQRDETPVNGKQDGALGSFSAHRYLYYTVFALLAVYTLFFLYHAVQLVIYPYDADNSEAYVINQGARLANGEFLYPPIDVPPFLVDNYPPVYPLLLAAGYLWMEPNFHWARFLSLAATLGVAAVIFFWTRRHTCSKSASFFAALVFLSFYHVYDWCALARVDSVGLLLTLLGLYWIENKGRWWFAAVLMLLALYTKQSLFAAPLAIFAYLYATDRRQSLRYIISLGISGVLVLLLMQWLSGGGAWKHLVTYNNNDYRFTDLLYYTRHWVGAYTVWGIAPFAVLLLNRKRDAALKTPLLCWYILFAIAESSLCGKIGSAPNYLLSLVAAAAVSCGLLFHLIRTQPAGKSAVIPVLFLLANLFQLLGTFHLPMPGQAMIKHPMDWSYTPSKVHYYANQLVQSSLERERGEVLSDIAGPALLAGHPPLYQPFIFTQLARQGMWNQDAVVQRIANHEYSRIVLTFDAANPRWDTERFTAEFINAVRNHYSLERNVGPFHFYRPNRGQ